MIYKPRFHSYKTKRWMHDTTQTKIIMNETPLQQVDVIKFLGVMINNKLTWDDHKKLYTAKGQIILESGAIATESNGEFYVMKENDKHKIIEYFNNN